MTNLGTPPGQGGSGGQGAREDADRKARSKSHRSFAIFAIFGSLMTVLLIGLFFDHGFGEGKMQAKLKAQHLAEERSQYQKKIANPEQASEQSYQAALNAINKQQAAASGAQQLSTAIAPPPGNLPPAPSSAPSPAQYNAIAYANAHRAIAGAQDQGQASSRVSVPGAGAAAQPAFVVYVQPKTSKNLLPSASGATQTLANPGSGILPSAESQKIQQDCNGDPQCVDAERNAYMARQAAAARAPGTQGPANTVNPNADWLYRQQNSKVTAFRSVLAKTGKGLYWIAPGTVVNGVLESAVDTRLPGQIIVRVTNNVYDSRYGRYLVIPAGSLLEGTYNSSVQDGQHRVMVAMNTLVTPSGGEVKLGGMTLSDGLGRSGVPGQLHTHFFERMGIAFLMGLEADEMDRLSNVQSVVSSPYGNSNAQGISSGGQIIVTAANAQIHEMFALGPNITVRPGAVVSLMTSSGVEIPPVANTR
jgi:type IV secretion system protein VirB10